MDAFQGMASELEYPMFVVTACDGDRRAGCLVGFATQCSIRPPRMLVCISKRNFTFEVVRGASTVAIHRLTRSDVELARLFGEESGDGIDKFESCEWSPGPGDTVVLTAVRAWVAAHIVDRFDVGDHVALLVEPFDGQWRPSANDGDLEQYGFQSARSMEPGHEA